MLAGLIVAACAELSSNAGGLAGSGGGGAVAALSARPDLTDDLFLLAARALNYSAPLVVTPQVLPPLLDAALPGTLVQHREACRSVLNFLRALLDPSAAPAALATAPAAQQLLREQVCRVGGALSRLLLAGAAGALPDARVPDVAEPLAALLRLAGPQALAWLSEAVSALPAAALDDADKQLLLGAAAVLANAAGGGGRADTDDFEAALCRAADLCRRNARSRRAALQVLLPLELQTAAGM